MTAHRAFIGYVYIFPRQTELHEPAGVYAAQIDKELPVRLRDYKPRRVAVEKLLHRPGHIRPGFKAAKADGRADCRANIFRPRAEGAHFFDSLAQNIRDRRPTAARAHSRPRST